MKRLDVFLKIKVVLFLTVAGVGVFLNFFCFATAKAQSQGYASFNDCLAAQAGNTAGCCALSQFSNDSNCTGQKPSSSNSGTSLVPQCVGDTTLSNGICVPNNHFTGLAGASDLMGLIAIVIQTMLLLAGVIAVVFVIVGGFWYMTASGNDEQAEKGRSTLLNAIIGVVVVLMAYALVTIITNLVTSKPVGS